MIVVQDAQQNESRGLVWDEGGGGGEMIMNKNVDACGAQE